MSEAVKSVLRDAFRRFLLDPRIYRLHLATFHKAAEYCSVHRQAAINLTIQSHLRLINPEHRVMSGPFQHMLYNPGEACGSQLYPKIVGSCESEIHPWIEAACREPKERIVDVGCAEGYYATGLALRAQNTEVFAFDTNPHARHLCAALARANGVEHRLRIDAVCLPRHLAEICREHRCLVVADCEGYEAWLFDRDNIGALRQSVVLVEVHDFISPEAGTTLRELFGDSHQCERIGVMPAEERLERYRRLLQSDRAPAWVSGLLLDEKRPPEQYWLRFTPR